MKGDIWNASAILTSSEKKRRFYSINNPMVFLLNMILDEAEDIFIGYGVHGDVSKGFFIGRLAGGGFHGH